MRSVRWESTLAALPRALLCSAQHPSLQGQCQSLLQGAPGSVSTRLSTGLSTRHDTRQQNSNWTGQPSCDWSEARHTPRELAQLRGCGGQRLRRPRLPHRTFSLICAPRSFARDGRPEILPGECLAQLAPRPAGQGSRLARSRVACATGPCSPQTAPTWCAFYLTISCVRADRTCVGSVCAR